MPAKRARTITVTLEQSEDLPGGIDGLLRKIDRDNWHMAVDGNYAASLDSFTSCLLERQTLKSGAIAIVITPIENGSPPETH